MAPLFKKNKTPVLANKKNGKEKEE